jgi:hypothetical protein
MGKAADELLAPAVNRLIADRHVALEEQLLDGAQAAFEPEIPTQRMDDDHPGTGGRDKGISFSLSHEATRTPRQRDRAATR